MEEFILSSAYQEDGIGYYYGYRGEEVKLYRWEVIATRLRWGEAGDFRRKAAERGDLVAHSSFLEGILPVVGPVSYQGQKLIGWEARSGEPLLANFLVQRPLAEGLALLEPLLHSYHTYHQRGLIVGCPDWHRIYLGETGVFMPDPLLLSYLATPRRPLPVGLGACHPPETYSGQVLNQKGDLFYLGLLIYLVVTGHLPYPLVQGWPTEALQRGVIIPPDRWRPELPTALCRALERLLAVEPLERPAVHELITLWPRLKSKPRALDRAKRGRIRSWWDRVNLYFRLYRYQWGKTALIFVGLLLLSWGLGKGVGGGGGPPLPAAQLTTLFEEMADPSFPDHLLPGRPELWPDLLSAKEERRTAAAALLTRPVLEVETVTVLRHEKNSIQVEVDLLWHHWREGRWQTVTTREQIRIVRRGSRWEIVERQPLK